jgi:glycosyltransferase involved in cell wall biosynthesis
MHLAFQKVSPEIKWEIIVVDNASTDNTGQVASLNWSKYGLAEVGFKVVKELKAGLSYARHKGINEAAFEYLIFCDDDNWLSENYIETAYNIISENAKIGIWEDNRKPKAMFLIRPGSLHMRAITP